MKGKVSLIAVFLFLFVCIYLAADQDKNAPLEFFAFYGLNLNKVDTLYSNEYNLNFNAGRPNSFASQEVLLQSKSSSSIYAGVSYAVAERFRLKLSVDYSRIHFKGQNSPYKIHLDYVTLIPPNYDSFHLSYDVSKTWPDTQGTLKTLGFLLNLQCNVLNSKKIAINLSAGGGYYIIFGDFFPLGYSDYWLGGHGVLMYNHYLIKMKIPSTGKIGGNADFELEYKLSSRISLTARAAYNLVDALSVVPVIEKVFYYELQDEVAESTLSDIKKFITFDALKINPSFFSIHFGIKIRLPY